MASIDDVHTLRLDLNSRIERLAGEPLTAYCRVQGGYTPALRLVCAGVRTSFFAKIATNRLGWPTAAGSTQPCLCSSRPKRAAGPLERA